MLHFYVTFIEFKFLNFTQHPSMCKVIQDPPCVARRSFEANARACISLLCCEVFLLFPDLLCPLRDPVPGFRTCQSKLRCVATCDLMSHRSVNHKARIAILILKACSIFDEGTRSTFFQNISMCLYFASYCSSFHVLLQVPRSFKSRYTVCLRAAFTTLFCY